VNGVLDALRGFQFAQAAAYRRASEALGVSEGDFNALRGLVGSSDENGLAMKDLAHEIGVSPAVLTGIVDRLEERGWIRRQLNRTDRRSIVVVPTIAEESDVLHVLHALDEPVRKVANSLPADAAVMVKQLAAAMVAELRDFDPLEVVPPHS